MDKKLIYKKLRFVSYIIKNEIHDQLAGIRIDNDELRAALSEVDFIKGLIYKEISEERENLEK